jgi:hypothetical protein
MLEKRRRFSVVFRNDSLKTKITLHCTLRIFYISEKKPDYLSLETNIDKNLFSQFWSSAMAAKHTIDLAGCFPHVEFFLNG